jgi:hypothetical protein
MKINFDFLTVNGIIVGFLGVAAILVITAVLTGRNEDLPLISSNKSAFLALAVIGFAMCIFGSLSNIQPDEWLEPMNIIASMLGVLAILLVLAVMSGTKIPLMESNNSAFTVLTVIIIAKVILATFHHVVLKS